MSAVAIAILIDTAIAAWQKLISHVVQEADITCRTLEVASWLQLGAGATTLWTATLTLVHSTTEYCALVWCRSAHTHLIDPTINDALRIVTGCLRPTAADKHAMLSCMSQWSHTVSSTPWITNRMWSGQTTPQDSALSSPKPAPTPLEWPSEQPELGLPASAPVSDVSPPVCTNTVWPPLQPVSVTKQNKPLTTLVHQCPIHRFPHGLHDLMVLDDETIEWLHNTCPEI